jgi:hypothetical protein
MSVIRLSAVPASRDGGGAWALHGEADGAPPLAEGVGENTPVLGRIAVTREMVPREIAFEEAGLAARLDAALADWDGEGPVVVLVHGFQFDSRLPGGAPGESVNPHVQLYRFSELDGGPGGEREHDTHATPWLARLAASGTGERLDRGVAVAFGYESWGNELGPDTPTSVDLVRAMLDLETRSGRKITNVYAQAYRDSEIAGMILAKVLAALDAALARKGAREGRDLGPRARPVDLLAHSLGTRTALKAIERVALDHTLLRDVTAMERLGRVLLVAGAAHVSQAMAALEQILESDSESRPEFYNFTSSADDVIALLGARAALIVQRTESGETVGFLRALWRFIRGGEMIGREGGPAREAFADPERGYPGWVDIQLDSPEVRAWGERWQLDLVGAREGLGEWQDHWVHYTHPGNWELYRRILARRPGYAPEAIRAGLDRFSERFDWRAHLDRGGAAARTDD